MEYIAIAKNIKISPRKMRLVADDIKTRKLSLALSHLTVMNKRASGPIKKALESAISNAVNNKNADKNMLQIKDIIINEGAAMKRFHYAARGRVRPYKRRMSHVRVILVDSELKTALPIVKVEEKVKKEKTEGKESSK